MNTKEAIEFINNIPSLGLIFDPLPLEKRKKQLIELLQRGEEYKRILEHIGVISNNEQVNRIIRDTLLGG